MAVIRPLTNATSPRDVTDAEMPDFRATIGALDRLPELGAPPT